MAESVTRWLATSKRVFSRFLFWTAALGIAFHCGNHASDSAPIAFQFEATISHVQGDVSALNLPFSLAIGKQIAGKYSFQSDEDLLDIFLHNERGKQGLVTLTIDGTEIEAATNFGSLNSAGVLDPPIAGPTSSIFLDYISPTDVYPGWPGSVGGHSWSQRLILLGANGTITDPEHLIDVDFWNQLTLLRRLDLQFGYPNTVSIQATIGQFIAVPEPSTTWMLCVLLSGAIKGVRTH